MAHPLREADKDRGGGNSQDCDKKRKGKNEANAFFGHKFGKYTASVSELLDSMLLP